MLSQRNRQISQEDLYDYFLVEADLAVDDQPIDFSKRYSDLESDDVSKSLGKKRHLSTTSINSEPTNCKQSCEDDLRVYCIEGTPLLISSSSSMCDLRDIAVSDSAISKKSFESKASLQFPGYPKTSTGTLKEQDELQETENSTVIEKDKSTETKDDNLQTFEVEGKFSKVSSPLMFSRSSSVCSLNSFEQHSIVDDRSSVSILSNLTSGIISPSEIPDSPGEAMSPFVHKNRQPEFKFPVADCEKESGLSNLKLNFNDICNETYDDVPEDDIKVYNVEGDCSSMSSFSELSVHTSSHMSVTYSCDENVLSIEQKTSVQMNCMPSTEFRSLEKSNLNHSTSSKENSAENQSSTNIDYVVPATDRLFDSEELKEAPYSITEERNKLPESEESSSKLESYFLNEDINMSLSKDEKTSYMDERKNEESYNSLSESDDEADALLEECIRNGRPSESSIRMEECTQTTAKEETCKMETAESSNSLSESDDEAEALLEECIRSGRPNETSLIMEESKQKSVKVQHGTDKFCSNEAFQNLHSNEYAHEKENDIILKHCIELGKPSKHTSDKLKKTVKVSDSQSNRFYKQKITNIQPNCKIKNAPSHSSKQLDITHHCNLTQGKRCRSQQTPHTFYGMKPFRPLQHDRTTDPMKKLRKEILIGLYRTLNEGKKSGDSDSDEEEMLLNQCIKLGMPDKKRKNHAQSPAHSPSKTNQVHLKSKVSQVSSQSRPEQNLSPSKTSPVFTHSRMGHVLLQSRASQVQSQSKTSQSRPVPCSQISSKRHQTSTRSCSSIFQASKDCSKNSKEDVNKSNICKLEKEVEEDESDLLQQCIQLGMPTKANSDIAQTKGLKNNDFQRFDKDLGYRDNRPDGTSDVEDDDDDILLEYINAGKPKQAIGSKDIRQQCSPPNKTLNYKPSKSGLQYRTEYGSNCSGKPQSLPFSSTKKVWPPPFIPDDDCMTAAEESPCVYKTEDTPVLSPTASISDLSTLSFSEEKNAPRSNLNNSRNSDCSSDSDEDDELLLQCIQSGMPASKRAVA